jgi:PHP family Zn ribbon phosphoesterase
MSRVAQLADRPFGYQPQNPIPYKNLIPLEEIIAEAKGVAKTSLGVERDYRGYLASLGNEFDIMLRLTEQDLLKSLPKRLAEGVLRVRQGKVEIKPGFDGEYGKISIFSEEERQGKAEKQLDLF